DCGWYGRFGNPAVRYRDGPARAQRAKGNPHRTGIRFSFDAGSLQTTARRGLGSGTEGDQAIDHAMEIGLLLHTRQIIRQEDAAQSFEHLWSDAAQAEEIGFDHIWLGDSVTVLDKARGDCLTTMAALAARTSTIRIGAVPMLPALRNPVLLAHALATLDVISKGRIILGVSVGPVRDYIQRQFAACGVPPKEKAGRLGECIEIIRRLWSEKTITFDGRYYKFNDVGVLP